MRIMDASPDGGRKLSPGTLQPAIDPDAPACAARGHRTLEIGTTGNEGAQCTLAVPLWRSRSISSLTCNFRRLSSTILRSSTAGWVRHSLISSSSAWCRFSNSARCDCIDMQYVSSISGSRRLKSTADSPQQPRDICHASAANQRKAFDWRGFSASLNALVENAIIALLLPRRRQAQKPAVAMTNEEERALREQLARLLQEPRDLDAAITALVTSPGSDLIQIQRLKKRKLVLRDKIRRIEDQLTPDIIA